MRSAWWEFVLSSGFGALGAVVAAVIAALVARSAARQRRRETDRDAWWARVTWVAERAAAEPPQRLDPLVAVHMLARLAGSPLAEAEDWRLLAALNEDVLRRARSAPVASAAPRRSGGDPDERAEELARASRELAAELQRRLDAAAAGRPRRR
ncbi:hypothetical protein CLV92_11629 [Kineococcus xinjiangensis]|uniref:Uncharacterized protein n=1 Tax=Kineococcus xinjiangensis TaxID=512762 RepID=A0A2S6ID70_9ACTN|nr:hypothetical protein [Kineococcus xinjiangensis]PPK92168.1 hypothetical protein CLV92_11629 [Kineococcus xinjiangensis]